MDTDYIINKIFSSSKQDIVATILGVTKDSFVFQLYNYPKAIISIDDYGETEFYVSITIVTNAKIQQSDLILGDVYRDYFAEKLKRCDPSFSVQIVSPISNKILIEDLMENRGSMRGGYCFFKISNEDFHKNNQAPIGGIYFLFYDSEFNIKA